MEDDELIERLNCCIEFDCAICPYDMDECENITVKNVVGLINRQKKEIERLTKEQERLIKFSKEGIDRWKKDFIRHFTRTLKQRIEDLGNLAMSEYHSVEIEIDDIAKEMGCGE